MTSFDHASEAVAPGSVPDPILDRLVFIAQSLGRNVDAEQLTAGIPLPTGRITAAELDECAGRAGLAVTASKLPAERVKSSMLPALIIGEDGDAVAVMHRDRERFELALPAIAGTHWADLERLQADHPGQWYFIRPVFYLDVRGLLYHLPQPRRWFWDVFKANRSIYLWALLATLLVNVLAVVIPFYAMAVYDRVVPNAALDSLWVLTTAAAVVLGFDLLNRQLRSYLLEAAARKADVALSSHIFAHSLRMRAESRPASGGVLANIVRDFETVRDFFTSTTLTLLGDLPFMLFFLAVIALLGGWIALVPAVIIPLALAAAWLVRRPLARAIEENMKDGAARSAHLFEAMNGLDTVKGLGAEAWARRKWEALTLSIADNNLRTRELSAVGNNVVASLISLNTILLVMFGALQVVENAMTLGQLIAVTLIGSRAITPVAQLAGLLIRWEQTKVALIALDRVMAAPTDSGEGGLHLPALRGAVAFQEVEFAYPQQPPLLKNVNLRIEAGEKVGFIGRIGSGKSTLLKLVLNLYAPQRGTVMVDGIPVTQMDALSLRRQIGYVPQEVTLFHGSIKENILLEASDVSDSELLDAVRLAALEETLTLLPKGLATEVGERGERLSGGQRQAVAVARALLRRPRLLLLDEPSSMMDPATEHQLLQNLRGLKDTTLLLVTHRSSMLPLVDRLVVLDRGQVVLDGPRDQVLARLQAGPRNPMQEPMT